MTSVNDQFIETLSSDFDPDTIIRLLSKGADPNCYLLENPEQEYLWVQEIFGIDPDAFFTLDIMSALKITIIKSDLHLVHKILDFGADPDFGYPLTYAIRLRNKDIVEMLLEYGAKPLHCCDEDFNLLMAKYSEKDIQKWNFVEGFRYPNWVLQIAISKDILPKELCLYLKIDNLGDRRFYERMEYEYSKVCPWNFLGPLKFRCYRKIYFCSDNLNLDRLPDHFFR